MEIIKRLSEQVDLKHSYCTGHPSSLCIRLEFKPQFDFSAEVQQQLIEALKVLLGMTKRGNVYILPNPGGDSESNNNRYLLNIEGFSGAISVLHQLLNDLKISYGCDGK